MEALECYRPTQPGLLERWPERGQLRGVEARAVGGMPSCQYAEAFRRFQPYAGEYFV